MWDTFVDHYRGPRVLGLDLMRIGASFTIVAFHGSLQAQVYHRGLLRHGYLAVDVFFVLSGWLLTRQALRLRRGDRPLLTTTLSFWARRWFRILPAYWAILAALTLTGAALQLRFGLTPQALVRHALFLQTIVRPNLYAVSWTLVTEEWFYLLLPFAIAGLSLIGRRGAIAALSLALLLPLAARTALLPIVGPDALMTLPQTRFDGLVVGSALGAIWSILPHWRAQLVGRRLLLFVVGAVGFTAIAVSAPDGPLYDTVGLLAVSLLVGMTIPHMAMLRWPARTPARLPILVTYLSDLTYSLYLFHVVGYRLVDRLGIHSTVPYFLVALPVIFTGATLLHLLVERPFLAVRSRLSAARPALEPATTAA